MPIFLQKYLVLILVIFTLVTHSGSLFSKEFVMPPSPQIPTVDAPISPKDGHKIMKKRKVAKSSFRQKFPDKKQRMKPALKTKKNKTN